MVKPVAAAVAGALVSGAAMYTAGAKTSHSDAFATPALVHTVDGGLAPADQVRYPQGFRPATNVIGIAGTPAPEPVVQRERPVSRTVQAAPQREVVQVREAPAQRSWKKTAIVIGGSSAAGAGIGAITGGKKGALIGAAIGGGAASIYEATRRK